MPLTAGARLGPYEVLAPLGAGGMGEVYRARDTRLGRDVAVKVLPASVSADPARRHRFEHEVRAVAALNHPNILALYDTGTHGGVAYAVFELLEGRTFRSLLQEGPVAPAKVVDCGVQVCRGLAATHEKGIVHRDLKPENLFLTRDGVVKILDFGLARQTVVGDEEDTHSPTLTRDTGPGVVLGTVAYMSPEQARGETVDHRSDLFALGSVLYEMLSGHRAFQKDTAAETMTAILREDPPPAADPGRSIPPALDRIVRHCLEKRPEQRFQSASDIAFDLQGNLALSGPESGSMPVAAGGWRRRLVAAAGLLAAGCSLGAAVVWSLRPAPTEAVRVRPLTFSGRDGEPSASPDGRLVAFTSARDGVSRIWVKQLSGREAPLTSGPDRRPRFSPDGSSVLFLRGEGSTLAAYRVPLVGGEPRKILDEVAEADWSPDGRRIAFVRSRAVSGRPEHVLALADVQGSRQTVLASVRDFFLLHLRWSPDGRTIAVIKTVRVGFLPGDEIWLVDAATGKVRVLTMEQADRPLCGLAWSGPAKAIVLGEADHILGDSAGALARVVRKDLASGRERTLFWASDLFPTLGGSKLYASFDVLGPGRLVFDENALRLNLVEVSLGPGALPRAGRVLTVGSSKDRQPAYSPDGKRIVFSSNRSGNADLWVLEIADGALWQLTDDPAQDWDPAFTSDGKHVVWSSDRSGNLEIWIANADGSGARQLSRDGLDAENPTATRDGAWIVYASGDPAKRGIWKIRPDSSEATPLVPGPFSNAEVSPDGRFATFLRLDPDASVNTIGVVEVATGHRLPFEIRVPYRLGPDAGRVLTGRNRWLPGGGAIAWVGEDETGLTGIYAQDVAVDKDTSATRRKLAGFSVDYLSESFGLSPDRKKVTLATLTRFGRLMIAEGVPDVAPPSRF
ncbi:MAG TPA: protein kinase [Vicinamibacteria bacterium]|nr:protein kinase [Vicinamibacteria bacterium]